MTWNDKGTKKLAGIISTVSSDTCTLGVHFFTRVSSYQDWIKNHTGMSSSVASTFSSGFVIALFFNVI